MIQAVTLHLGAHRTGTTSIQRALDLNAEALRAAGCLCLTPPRAGRREGETIRAIATELGKLRRAVWPVLRRRAMKARLQGLIAAAGTEGVTRLIVSDENLIGPGFRSGPAFYPEARGRLTELRRILPAPVDEIHLAIRSYDSFLVSYYAMMALYGRAGPFEPLRARWLEAAGGWPALVDAIRAVFPRARLQLHPFERVRPEAVFAALSAATGGLAFPAEIRNPSPSAEAIRQAGLEPPPSSEAADALLARHAGGPAFDPLLPDEAKALRHRYDTDLARLGSVP